MNKKPITPAQIRFLQWLDRQSCVAMGEIPYKFQFRTINALEARGMVMGADHIDFVECVITPKGEGVLVGLKSRGSAYEEGGEA